MKTKERYLTAYHEAGHAVAAVVSGRQLISVSIGDNPSIRSRGSRKSRGFVSYAGPWAEGRAEWDLGPIVGLDEHVGCAVYRSSSDAAVFEREPDWVVRRWGEELEALYPLIQQVAEMLLEGFDDVALITAAVNAALAAEEAAS